MNQAELGSISTGTMKPEHMIPAFFGVLSDLEDSRAEELKGDYLYSLLAGIDSPEELLHELIVIMDEYAPLYAYFGAHPDDGADYGFWPDWEVISMAKYDGDLIQVNDLADVPELWLNNVLLVNDHGNVTLYAYISGEWVERWSVV